MNFGLLHKDSGLGQPCFLSYKPQLKQSQTSPAPLSHCLVSDVLQLPHLLLEISFDFFLGLVVFFTAGCVDGHGGGGGKWVYGGGECGIMGFGGGERLNRNVL